MGYRNRTLREDFDDLGDNCFVVIKNPKFLDMAALSAKVRGVDEKNSASVDNANFALLGSLITAWRMWDTQWEPADGETEDDRPELPAPGESGVPVEVMRLVPSEVCNWIAEQMPGKAQRKTSSTSR